MPVCRFDLAHLKPPGIRIPCGAGANRPALSVGKSCESQLGFADSAADVLSRSDIGHAVVSALPVQNIRQASIILEFAGQGNRDGDDENKSRPAGDLWP